MKLHVSPENRDKFIASANRAAGIAQGSQGWSGMAQIFVEMGFGSMLGLRLSRRKRIRKKQMKVYIKRAFMQDMVDNGLEALP